MPKPRADVVSQIEELLESMYLQDVPGMAVGTNNAPLLRDAIWRVVHRDRRTNPGAWPGLRIILSTNPMELYICRASSDPGSSDQST